MDSKYLAIIIAVIAIIGIAAGIFILTQDDQDQPDEPITPDEPVEIVVDRNIKMPEDVNLRVFGNVNGDSKIDAKDLDLLNDILSGKAKQTFYADANQDGVLNSDDAKVIEDLTNSKKTTAHYINYAFETCKATLPIDKIAVAYYQVLEAVVALGDFDNVVAADNRCFTKSANLFPGIEEKKNLGEIKTINAETIIASGATTLVTGSADYYLDGLESQLPTGYQVIRLCNAAGGDGIVWHMVTLGYLLGCEKQAANYESFYTDTVNLVADRIKGLKEKEESVGVYFYSTPKFDILCKTSGVYEVIINAGSKNLAEGLYEKGGNNMYWPCTPEELYAMNPEWLVATIANSGPNSTEESFTEQYENYMDMNSLKNLPAYKNGKTIAISYNIVNGIPLMVGTIYLAKAFYPTLFEDVDPAVSLQKYYDDFTLQEIDVTKQGHWIIWP